MTDQITDVIINCRYKRRIFEQKYECIIARDELTSEGAVGVGIAFTAPFSKYTYDRLKNYIGRTNNERYQRTC